MKWSNRAVGISLAAVMLSLLVGAMLLRALGNYPPLTLPPSAPLKTS